jgi:hypothetical protein
MTANVQYDPSTELAERHSLYETEVAEALLDESEEERAERLELVRAAEAMVLAAFHHACAERDPGQENDQEP